MPVTRITSTNLVNQSAQITFYPGCTTCPNCTGSSINLGTHLIPYDYNSNNYVGCYVLYFPYFDLTCYFEIPPDVCVIPSIDFNVVQV